MKLKLGILACALLAASMTQGMAPGTITLFQFTKLVRPLSMATNSDIINAYAGLNYRDREAADELLARFRNTNIQNLRAPQAAGQANATTQSARPFKQPQAHTPKPMPQGPTAKGETDKKGAQREPVGQAYQKATDNQQSPGTARPKTAGEEYAQARAEAATRNKREKQEHAEAVAHAFESARAQARAQARAEDTARNQDEINAQAAAAKAEAMAQAEAKAHASETARAQAREQARAQSATNARYAGFFSAQDTTPAAEPEATTQAPEASATPIQPDTKAEQKSTPKIVDQLRQENAELQEELKKTRQRLGAVSVNAAEQIAALQNELKAETARANMAQAALKKLIEELTGQKTAPASPVSPNVSQAQQAAQAQVNVKAEQEAKRMAQAQEEERAAEASAAAAKGLADLMARAKVQQEQAELAATEKNTAQEEKEEDVDSNAAAQSEQELPSQQEAYRQFMLAKEKMQQEFDAYRKKHRNP